jgi:hypothetical protein
MSGRPGRFEAAAITNCERLLRVLSRAVTAQKAKLWQGSRRLHRNPGMGAGRRWPRPPGMLD